MAVEPLPSGAFTSFEEATQFLEETCVRMEVNHLAYALMRSIEGSSDLMAWVTTYDPAYMSYYMQNHTQLGDPAFDTAFADNKVLDWVELLSHDPVSQELVLMAERYGITKYGISIPLQEAESDSVLFSVNVKSNDQDWPLLREALVERFRPFAHYFHQRVRPLIESRQI